MQQILDRAGGISLQQILPEGRLTAGDIRVSSCCSDWRLCRSGDLFVALDTGEHDGHEDVPLAIQRGACAIVAERLLPVSAPVCIVQDTREAYGRLCQALAGQPSDHLRVIGVTGTYGKTTTSLLLASILEAGQLRVGTMNSMLACDGLETHAARQSPPTSPELARWLARMSANTCDAGVLEICSESLAQRSASGIQLDAALLTNLRHAHADRYGSVVNYRRIKRRIFELLKSSGFAVINADDAASQLLLNKIHHPTISIGMRNSAELMGSVVERCQSEQTFLLMAGSETVPIRTRMVGDAHIYNCLSAAAVALVFGLDLTTIAAGLEAVQSLPGRLERIECGQPFGVFVDRCATPDGLSETLRTLRQVTTGRLICVYGASEHAVAEHRPLFGRAAERAAHLTVVTSHAADTKAPLSLLHEVLDGYQKPARPHLLPDRRRAIQWALEQAAPGDTVLLAGNSQSNSETFQMIDTEIARQLLYAAGERERLPKVPPTCR